MPGNSRRMPSEPEPTAGIACYMAAAGTGMIPNHRVDGLAPDPEETRRGVERCGGYTSFRVNWPNP